MLCAAETETLAFGGVSALVDRLFRPILTAAAESGDDLRAAMSQSVIQSGRCIRRATICPERGAHSHALEHWKS